jgi:hypothetical protein
MKKTILLLFTALIFFNCKQDQNKEGQQISIETTEPRGAKITYKWGYMALTAQANDTEKFKPRPTVS